MKNDALNTLILKQAAGEEAFTLESAYWVIGDHTLFIAHI